MIADVTYLVVVVCKEAVWVHLRFAVGRVHLVVLDNLLLWLGFCMRSRWRCRLRRCVNQHFIGVFFVAVEQTWLV